MKKKEGNNGELSVRRPLRSSSVRLVDRIEHATPQSCAAWRQVKRIFIHLLPSVIGCGLCPRAWSPQHFPPAPMFICVFFIYVTQRVSVDSALPGWCGLEGCCRNLFQVSRAAVSNLCHLKNTSYTSGPCFFFYSFKEVLEFHPIRYTQLQLFGIYLHANEPLRSFFRMKKGVWISPWIFLTVLFNKAVLLFNTKNLIFLKVFLKIKLKNKWNFHYIIFLPFFSTVEFAGSSS